MVINFCSRTYFRMCTHTGIYEFLKFTVQTALCNNQPSHLKKTPWNSYEYESEVDSGIKSFTMSFYITYWKEEFFQRHLRVNVVRVYRVTQIYFFSTNTLLSSFQKRYLTRREKKILRSGFTSFLGGLNSSFIFVLIEFSIFFSL